MMGTFSLARYGWLSVLAAVLTIGLKTQAYLMTGSVGLLSDAAESLINLIAAVAALLVLSFAARPADAGHPFGHGKAEYFASGLEGALILVAAAGIAWTAWERFLNPEPLAKLDIGMIIAAGAAGINLLAGWVLFRAGRKYGSIVLEADGRHLLSDVWTTAAVLLALGSIVLTGWLWLDPTIALVAALQIVWSGTGLIRRSVSGLLDAAIPSQERAKIENIFDRYRAQGIRFHDLRARPAGMQRLVTVHVLVPGQLSVQAGHDLLESIERDIRGVLPNTMIVSHLEPLEDVASFAHDTIKADDVAVHRMDFGRPPPSTTEPIQKKKIFGGAASVVGALLLLAGGVTSMLLPGLSADLALGVSLVGLLLILGGHWQRHHLKRTPPA